MIDESGRIALPTLQDTLDFGARIGRDLAAGDVVVLDGPLGAGKTALTKGIALGMDVDGPITSPSYVLARVHEARRPGAPALVHVDVYRPVSYTHLTLPTICSV